MLLVGHQVGQEDLFGTIQMVSCQGQGFLVMEMPVLRGVVISGEEGMLVQCQ